MKLNMKMKEVYEKNKNRKIIPIETITKENVSIESSPWEIIKKNKYRYLIGTLIIVLILLLTFYNYLVGFGVSCGLIAGLVLMCMVTNTYSFKCTKDSLQMKLNLFQTFDLPYNRILNIYLGKELSTTNFVPKFNYILVVRYIDNLGLIKELAFPTLFLQSEAIEKFLNNFILTKEESDTCIKYEKYKIGKKLLKASAFVLFVGAIGVLVLTSINK